MSTPKILFGIVYCLLLQIPLLLCQICPHEDFGQIDGYSCLTNISSHIIMKSSPSLANQDIIYTSNTNQLTQMNLLTSQTIQTTNTNNNANIVYMTKQDTVNRSIIVLADTSGCVIEIDVELNAEIQRYQLDTKLYTFDSTINIDYETQTVITYMNTNIFLVNYNTKTVFQPTLVGEKYVNSIVITGASSVLINMNSKAYICDIVKSTCKSLSLPNITLVLFFTQNGDYFAVVAYGTQGNSITLFSLNRTSKTTSRISYMTIPITINNMILDISNPSVQYAITVGVYDCRIFNFNTKQIELTFNLSNVSIDISDTLNTVLLANVKTALTTASFNHLSLSGNNLVISSAQFVVLINYQVSQSTIVYTKYIDLSNTQFNNVKVLPDNNILLVGDQTLVYLYNPSLQIYILNSCIQTFSLDSQVQSQFIQDDDQNTLLSINSSGISYQWNKLTGKIIYQVNTFPSGAVFKLSKVLSKIVYYKYGGYQIYDNFTKLLLVDGGSVAAQGVVFDETNGYIFMITTNTVVCYPVDLTTLQLKSPFSQTDTTQISQVFSVPLTSQIMVVRQSNASFCTVSATSISVVATVVDNFISSYYDVTLNILICFTQTSPNSYIKSYAFPSKTMTVYDNDPTQIYSNLQFNPTSLMMSMYIKSQNRVIGWTYNNATPTTAQQYVLKGFIYNIQYYFLDTVNSKNYVIAVTSNGLILVFDSTTQDIKSSYIIHNGLTPIQFYSDTINKMIVTYADDNRMVKYDYANGKLIKQWLLSSPPIGYSVDLSTSMIYIALLNRIYCLSYDSYDMLKEIVGYQSTTVPGAFSELQGQLVSTNDSKVRVYDMYSFSQITELTQVHTGPILNLRYIDTLKLIIMCSSDKTCSVWSSLTYTNLQILTQSAPNPSNPSSPVICNSPLGTQLSSLNTSLYVFCQTGVVFQWNYNTNTQLFEYKTYFICSTNPLQTVRIYDEQNLILALDSNAQGGIYYIGNQTLSFSIQGDKATIDKTNQNFITYGRNGTVLQYNLAGQLIYNYTIHLGFINQLFQDTAAQKLFSISDDKSVYYYDNYAHTNFTILQSYTHTAPLKTGIYDNQSNLLIIADSLGSILFLNYPLLGLKQMLYNAHSSQIINISLSKITNMLVSFGSDNAIRMWNYYAYIKTDYRILIYTEGSIQDGFMVNEQAITMQQNGMLKMWDFNAKYQKFMKKLKSDVQDFRFKVSNLGSKNKILINSLSQIFMLDSTSFQIINQSKSVCSKSMSSTRTDMILMIFCINQNQVNVYGESLTLLSSQPTHSISTIFVFTDVQINETLMELSAYTSKSTIVIWKYTTAGVFSTTPLMFSITPQSQIVSMFYILSTGGIYNLVVATISGTIQVFSYDTINTPTFSQELDLVNNNKKLVFIQLQDNRSQILIFNTNDWSSLGFLISPCPGYQNRFDYSVAFDLICISCFGQYNIYTYQTLQMIGYVRIISEFTNFSNQDVNNNDDLRIISSTYILHAKLQYIFIFSVNRASSLIVYKGKVQQVKSFSKVLRFTYNQQPTYSSGEYVFIGTKVSKLMFIIDGSTSCTQSMQIIDVKKTFQNVIDISNRLSTFFIVQSFSFRLSLDNNQALPEIPSFPFASQSSLCLNCDSNQVYTINSFQKFYSSVSGFISVSLMNLNLAFDKQIGQSGTQQLIFNNITTVSLTNCALLNTSQIIISFQQIKNVVLNSITIDTQIIDGGKNPDPQNLNSYLFTINNTSTLTVNSLKVINSQFISTALMQVNNFGLLFNSSSQVASQGIVNLNGITINSNAVNFASANAFIELLFLSQVTINNLNITNNTNSASIIPLSIPLMLKMEICNTKSLVNAYFISNTDFIFLYDQNFYGSSQSGTNTTSVSTSANDDSLIINTITIQQNQFTNPLSSTSTIKTHLVKLNSDVLSLTQVTINQNTCASPCQVLSVLNVDGSKNSYLDTLNAFSNTGFNSSVILISNTTIIGKSWFSGQNNCTKAGAIVFSTAIAQITTGLLNQNICQIEGCGGAILSTETSNVTLNGVNFTENQSASYGGAILQIKNSILKITIATFDSNTAVAEGGGVFSYQSSLNLTKVIFTKNRSNLNGGAIYIERGSFYVNDSFLSKNNATNSGGALFCLDVPIVQLFAFQAYYNMALFQGGGALIQNGQLTLQHSIFEYNSCSEGGGLYLSTIATQSEVSSTKFFGNLALGSGGGLMMDTSNCNVQDCIFSDNTAGAGGAIRYINLKPVFMIPTSQNSILDTCRSYSNNVCNSNSGIIFGRNIVSYPSQIKIIPGLNNLNITLVSQTPLAYQINDVQSGINSLNLQYQLLDEFGEEVKYQKENLPITIQSLLQDSTILQIPNIPSRSLSQIQPFISQTLFSEIDGFISSIINNQPADIKNYNLLIERDYITRYEGSSFLIESLRITGIPKQTAKFMVSFDRINTFLPNNTLATLQNVYILISFRECIQGEAFTKYCDNCTLSICKTCQEGTYILDPPSSYVPQNCINCNKPFAASCYQSTINLLPGYWRSNNMTDVVSACDNNFNLCLGDGNHGYCQQGYQGTLCETCDQLGVMWGEIYANYDIQEMKICQKCSEIFTNLPQYIIYFIIICCLISILINNANSKIINHMQAQLLSKSQILNLGKGSISGKSLMIFKICIFYMQILTALVKFNIIFEDSLKIAKFIPIYLFSPIITMEYWFDCVYSSIDVSASVQYMRLIWSLILYTLIFIGSMIAYFVLVAVFYTNEPHSKRYLKLKYISSNFFSFAVLFYYYLMQHSILQNFMKILSCSNIGGQDYIVGQLDKECNDFEHGMWQILFIIPIFVIMGYAIPFYIIHFLYANRSKLYNPSKVSLIRVFGFFYFEYKQKYWYWEFLKLQLRTLIIIFLNSYDDDIKKKGCFVLLILMIYALLAFKNQPYSLPQMNRLDQRINIITAFLIWFVMLSSRNNDDGQVNFMLTMMAILMIILIIHFFYQLMSDICLRYEKWIIESRPIQFILFYAGYILSKERFEAKNGFLKRHLPYLYRIIHCQNQISFDHMVRWRFLKAYITDFGRRRRKDKYAQFYLFIIQAEHQENTSQKTGSTHGSRAEVQIKQVQSTKEFIDSKQELIGEITPQKQPSQQSKNMSNKKSQNEDNHLTDQNIVQKQSIKKTTSVRQQSKEELPPNIQTPANEIDDDDGDERDEIIKKIYPVRRPVMQLYNDYSGMKIDNYKDAQIMDICKNPFYYHDYSNFKPVKPADKITVFGESNIKDLKLKIVLNKTEDLTCKKTLSIEYSQNIIIT